MKFIFGDNNSGEQLTFAHVETNQFFIDFDWRLCQKLGETEYVQIARPNGEPYCNYFHHIKEDTPIRELMDHVRCIKF